jgi:integrase
VVATDPTEDIVKPRPDLKADATISRAQEPLLFAAAAAHPDPTVEAMLLLGLDAGLRIGEILGLSGASVLKSGGRYYLDLFQQVTRSGLVPQTKGHRKRQVPMTARLIEVIVPMAEKAGPLGLLFPNQKDGGARDYHNTRNRVWAPLMAAVGLSATLHDLRHTYGSRLAEGGMPRSEIAILMGHADEKTTARYIHSTDDGARADRAMAALEGSLNPSASLRQGATV